MRHKPVADLSKLPTNSFGSRSLTWWGTLAFMMLEGMGFALAIAAYLYLMTQAPRWPLNAPPPDILAGSLVTLLFITSEPLNRAVSRWAHKENLRKVQIGLTGMSLFGIAPLIARWFEFNSLNVRWDYDAYGSVLWFLLGLHTLHLLTDVGETLVLTCLMFSRHAKNPRRFSDVADNAFYWDFVILSWLPIYLLIYWVPRW
jgi:cytochrome c oxidase subunit III